MVTQLSAMAKLIESTVVVVPETVKLPVMLVFPATLKVPRTCVLISAAPKLTAVAVAPPRARVVAVLASRASVVIFSTASRGP